MFSGVRKFAVGVTVAHQDLYQLHRTMPEVERAVLANAHTRVCFRLGENDARQLAGGFAHYDSEALTGLRVGEAVCRIGTSRDDCNLRIERLPSLGEGERRERAQHARSQSLERHGARRQKVERVDREANTEPERGPEPAPRPTARRQRPVPPAAEEGVGGPEHTYLQSLLAEWAQGRGFRVTSEAELPGGGRVDLVFENESRRVACEISVTTSVAHELEAVRRCVAAGYSEVLVVARRKRFLRELSSALEAEPAAVRDATHVGPPEDVLAHLATSETISERRVAGYKVRRRVATVSAEERERRRGDIARTIARSIRK